MRLQQSTKVFPLGLMVFVLAVAFHKALVLTLGIGAGWQVFWELIGLDSFFIILLMLLAIGIALAAVRVVRVLTLFALLLMVSAYLLDSQVLLALDDHASWFDIIRYTSQPTVVMSFLDIKIACTVFLFLGSIFVWSGYGKRVKKLSLILLAVLSLLCGLGVARSPEPLLRYAMFNPLSFMHDIRYHQTTSSYTPEQIAFYAGLPEAVVSIPVSRPDIILLIIESLSAINSEKISAGPDLLSGFDELAQEGVLFTNFFANHQASEGGVIALLGGYPPIHFPTATPYMFDEFAIQPAVVDEYKQRGYHSEFLTNSDLSFIGLDRFLSGLKFDLSRGRDEVAAMKNAPRFVQDAPSDALLYDEALLSLKRLSVRTQPFLLVLASTSTHLPYTHPDGGPNSAVGVWNWSLRQLTVFYGHLLETGYFEHGILLITGDHRQMRPKSVYELARYGDSAKARIPLLVIGKGYPGGKIDERFFQQSDLLRKLGEIMHPTEQLSPHPIWVERYNRKYGRIALIDNLGVFDAADQGRHEYRLRAPGNRIEWLEKRPDFARGIETRIHQQKSLHQKIRMEANTGPAGLH